MSVIQRRLAHATSVVVMPAVAIVSSSVAAASVIETLTPHGLASGDTALIAGHDGSTPTINGTRVVTVISPLTFSIPVTVTIAGTGGTVTKTTAAEPFTLAQGLLLAGFEWAAGDVREPLMTGWIAAARQKVEQDTGLALLSQMRDVYFDAITGDLDLPAQSMPLQSVVSITSVNTAGVVQTVPADQYHVDAVSGRLGLAYGASWPADLRPFQPWIVRLVSGWSSPTRIPPALLHAVGLMTAHYATHGRDVTIVGTIVAATPYGYEDAIAPFCRVTLP
jgi:uncharacterized phiE125 gp8 family phage protein